MYADDTVLLAESPDDLQTSLLRMQEYCTLYDLKLNISKTNAFSRGKLKTPHLYYFGEEIIDVVNAYYNIGIILTRYNAKFNVAKQNLYQKGNRAMFALYEAVKPFTNLVNMLYCIHLKCGRRKM